MMFPRGLEGGSLLEPYDKPAPEKTRFTKMCPCLLLFFKRRAPTGREPQTDQDSP